MRDIIMDVVGELQKEKTLKNGWSRDCPVDRSERGLIEVWVATINKVRSKYVADILECEKRVQSLHDELKKAYSEKTTLLEKLHDRENERIAVGIGAHIDRLADRINTEETTRLLADTVAR